MVVYRYTCVQWPTGPYSINLPTVQGVSVETHLLKNGGRLVLTLSLDSPSEWLSGNTEYPL